MARIYAAKTSEITQREKEHMEFSREMARECMVLLENDGALPLPAGGKLALFGAGAGRTVKGGTGSGDVNTRSQVSAAEGLKEAGYTITTEDWIRRQDEKCAAAKKAYQEWVPRAAEEEGCMELQIIFSHPYTEPEPEEITEDDLRKSDTDTAVYVLSRNSGEGADRYDKEGDYLLSRTEKEQLIRLGAYYRKVILVLNIGGVMDLSEVRSIPGIHAVLLMTQLGNMGGSALADILTGAAVPSGKLTDTWAKRYEDYPSSAEFGHNDGNTQDEYYREGIYTGYRYFDTFGIEPLYCFGYGKSYTEFEIDTQDVRMEGTRIVLSVQVRNAGKTYPGQEVVQVYYSAPAGRMSKPYQELAAFEKTRLLQPGETECLELSLDMRSMASYSEEDAAWMLEKGRYILRVGNSSRNTAAVASVVLERDVTVFQARSLFREECPVTEIEPPFREIREEEKTPRTIVPDISGWKTEKAVYTEKRQEYTTDKTQRLTMEDVLARRCSVEELTAQLTVEEMAQYCVGTMRMDGGSIIGNASDLIPGAAGDTSPICAETRKIKSLIMADGPAGLRLQPVFKTTKDGKLLPGGEVMGESCAPFDPELKDEETDTYYQYCTAVPVGWALAQSWNQSMLEKTGDMIGKEMELFGVDLWLAPALNIHRNPLCGRNFEYFSEDPFVAGKTAAAITKGVQSHPGKGVTLKHFAANNQEDNRYFTNSHVRERALREIYLKGFEIAVKEAKPLAIMTSYNLINGIHTANSRDLLQSAARDEWGFDGLVMTDWFTTQDVPMMTGESSHYPISASTGCIYAGNDLQMPGCRKNVEDIVKAVLQKQETDGYAITKADLQFNTANILRVIARTTIL